MATPFMGSAEQPLCTQACLLVGMALMRESDTRGAAAALERARTAEDKEVLALLAICTLQLGDAAAAHRTFARAVDLERVTHGFLTHDHVFLYARECRRAQEWTEFWRWLAVLVESYAALRITDASFLGIRELPPFESVVAEATRALEQGAPPPPDRAPWDQLAAAIDDEGGVELSPLLKRLGWGPTRGA
ncbi:MAG: hypothetical protein HMLKMBBP_01639 [Planctomycetes bacterium]|nr:hypothetical protein [Planctomycetota bacterium]